MVQTVGDAGMVPQNLSAEVADGKFVPVTGFRRCPGRNVLWHGGNGSGGVSLELEGFSCVPVIFRLVPEQILESIRRDNSAAFPLIPMLFSTQPRKSAFVFIAS